MRMLISGVVMFLLMMLVLTFARDNLRPPQAAELTLTELDDETTLEALDAGVADLEFDCTNEERGLESGERVCFAPVSRVGAYQGDYLSLFLEGENALAAVNIVLDPEHHEANHKQLRERLGEPDRKLEEAAHTWLVWERDGHRILTHQQPPEEDAPALMWFRSPEHMERLLPR
ncbi:MAG: hypothetical protein ACOCZF_01045 [Halorhodospira sp.]